MLKLSPKFLRIFIIITNEPRNILFLFSENIYHFEYYLDITYLIYDVLKCEEIVKKLMKQWCNTHTLHSM